MSLVGPRPLPQRDFDQLEDWHKKRYLVLPGITGLWQVSGRSELDFDDLVRLDFLYLERWSVGLDLSILLKTVPAVFSRARRLLSVTAVSAPRCGTCVRYRFLFEQMVRRELRQKYKGSALGVAWYLVNPLVLMGAYALVFGVLLKVAAACPTTRCS